MHRRGRHVLKQYKDAAASSTGARVNASGKKSATSTSSVIYTRRRLKASKIRAHYLGGNDAPLMVAQRACPRPRVIAGSSATARAAPVRTCALAYVRIKRRGVQIGSQQPYSNTLQANGPWPGPQKNSYHPEIRTSRDRITEVLL